MDHFDEVTSREAAEILGVRDPSSVARWAQIGRLKPSRKLPGKTGAYLFRRVDVEQLRDELAAGRAAS